LSAEATAAAASIHDDVAAQAFLRAFGSHVTWGHHDVSGLWMQSIDTTTAAVPPTQLLAACSAQADAWRNGSLGYGRLGFGVVVDVHATTLADGTPCEVTTRWHRVGPPCRASP